MGLLRANQCLVGTCKKGGNRDGCGAKRKCPATAEETAAQVAAAVRDNFSTTKVRKAQVQTMLEERLGPAFKRNSLAKYIDELLEREIAEAADLLGGTMLEGLACPRKHAPGKKMDGELLLFSRIYNTLPLPLHTACNRISCSLDRCGVAADNETYSTNNTYQMHANRAQLTSRSSRVVSHTLGSQCPET